MTPPLVKSGGFRYTINRHRRPGLPGLLPAPPGASAQVVRPARRLQADGKLVHWLMEFKWSEAVDPKVFEPNIPSDYTLLVQ